MNIYEAYLAVKDGNIIKATVVGSTYFILQTTEHPLNKKRIVWIKRCNTGYEDVMPTSLDGIEFEELTEVCMDSFDITSKYEVISFENLIFEIQSEWKENNS